MSIGKLTGVAVISDTALSLTWDDGHSAVLDLAKLITARSALAPLSDSTLFADATLAPDGWSVEWPCGVDFGAVQLRRWADEQAGATMRAADFRCWIESHQFTLDAASDALGLSRRTIAYYLSGEQVISKTVMLATIGFDRRQAA